VCVDRLLCRIGRLYMGYSVDHNEMIVVPSLRHCSAIAASCSCYMSCNVCLKVTGVLDLTAALTYFNIAQLFDDPFSGKYCKKIIQESIHSKQIFGRLAIFLTIRLRAVTNIYKKSIPYCYDSS